MRHTVHIQKKTRTHRRHRSMADI